MIRQMGEASYVLAVDGDLKALAKKLATVTSALAELVAFVDAAQVRAASVKAAAVAANTPLSNEFDTVLPLLSQRVQNRLISLRPDLHEVINKTVEEVALRLAARRQDLDNAAALLWARRRRG